MSVNATAQLRPRFLPDREALQEWGGKGASLVRMIRKGYAVPPVACMGLTQVQNWLGTLPEHALALEAWRRWDADAPTRLASLQAAIRNAPMPEHWDLSGATLRKFLCGDTETEAEPWPMILRSSMSVEDGATESLAGCFESVVVSDTSPRGLWQGFLQVVASGFSPLSAERLLAAGVDPVRFRVGVVIQSYLVAELAGVCFSRDPLNPWDRNGQVEWVQGAGEGLVQGTVPAKKRRRFEGADPETAQLWDGLWKRADSAEKLVGGPADLEWVWDGAQLWFVQARPIATPEARLVARAPGRRWSRAQTMERFPEAITPMGWSVLRGAFTGNLTSLSRRFGVVAKSPEDVAISLRGTVYSDPQFFSFPGGVRIRWAKYLNPLSRAPWAVLGTFFRCLGRSLGGTRQNLSRALLKLDLADALVGAQARQIEAGWDRHRDHSLERLRSFDPLGPAHRLLDRMAALEEIGREFMEPDLAVYLVKETYHKALLGVWRALGLADHDFSDLFRAFTGNRTLEMNQDLDACIQSLRQDPGCPRFIELLEGAHSLAQGLLAAAGLSPDAQAKWNHFITRNGHSTTTWDIATPSWLEDPSRLAPLLQASVKAPALSVKQVQKSELRVDARTSFGALLKSWYSRSATRRLLLAVERLEAFMRMDEEHHFLSGVLLVPSRQVILAGGDALTQQALLESKEAVFFLTLEELKAALQAPGSAISFVPLARRRESEWRRSFKSNPPFELPEPPRTAREPCTVGAVYWQGSPMSPGIVTGRVLIAEHIDQISGIEPGTILVTTSPNPALTPLYPLLGGLIAATGSALSHGFVSAREYALPAVSGIARATDTIPNGAWVRLDGNTGLVEVIQP